MRPTEPLPLHHSWPLFDLHIHLAPAMMDDRSAGCEEALAARGIGLWQCDLEDDRLSWTSGVYDLFGLERGAAVPRSLAVSLYEPHSRDAMEQLRAYAIKHHRGFTLDVAIRPLGGGEHGVRLIAAPVLHEDRVVALRGIKQVLPRGMARLERRGPLLFDAR